VEVLKTYADGAVDIYFWTKSGGVGCSHQYHLAKDGKVFVYKAKQGGQYRQTLTAEPRIRRIRTAFDTAREASYRLGQGVRCELTVPECRNCGGSPETTVEGRNVSCGCGRK
jgi:hypothetical protein